MYMEYPILNGILVKYFDFVSSMCITIARGLNHVSVNHVFWIIIMEKSLDIFVNKSDSEKWHSVINCANYQKYLWWLKKDFFNFDLVIYCTVKWNLKNNLGLVELVYIKSILNFFLNGAARPKV